MSSFSKNFKLVYGPKSSIGSFARVMLGQGRLHESIGQHGRPVGGFVLWRSASVMVNQL